ncbi:hypothetical protein KAT92_00985, partial [Candidatus Babeliales bacterium]|nr:hypothetical protein [Candidatus Babeliales bacterium]
LGAVAAKKATGAIDKSVCTSQGAKRAVQDIKTTTSDILKLEDANGRFLEDPVKNANLFDSVKNFHEQNTKYFSKIGNALQNVGTQTAGDKEVLQALQGLLSLLFSYQVKTDIYIKDKKITEAKIVTPFQAPLARLSCVLLQASNQENLDEFKNEFLSIGTGVIIAKGTDECALVRFEVIEQIFSALVFITQEGGFADASKQISLADHRGLLDIARIEKETCNHQVVDITENVAELEQAATVNPEEGAQGGSFWSNYACPTLKWGGLGAAIIGGGYGLYKGNQRINELQELGGQGVTLLGEVDREGFDVDRRDRLEKLANDDRVPNNFKPVIDRLVKASEVLPDGVSLKECEEKAKYFKEHPYRMVASEVLNWGKSWIPSRPGWLGGVSAEQEEQENNGDDSEDDEDDFVDADNEKPPEDEIVIDDEEVED